MIEPQTVFDVEEPETLTQLRDVVFFGTEHESARAGMQTVRRDDEIVAAGGSVAEGHIDSPAVVIECGNAHAEAVIDVVADGFVQDAGERSPVNLDLTADHFGGQAADLPTPAVDECQRSHAGGSRSHLVEQTHLLEHRERGAAKVDSLSAGSQLAGLLDDRHGVTVPGEPAGQAGPGDPATADQDVERHCRGGYPALLMVLPLPRFSTLGSPSL